MFLGPDEGFDADVAATAAAHAARDHRLLARLGAHPVGAAGVAGGGDPRGHHAEALRLRGDRRHRRGPDHLDPGARRRRRSGPQLGLPLLLAPRRLLRGPGAEPAGRGRHAGELPRLPAQPGRPGQPRRRPRRSRVYRPVGPTARPAHQPVYGVGWSRADRADRRTCRAIAAWGRCGSATRRTSTCSTTSTARSSCPPCRPSSTSGCCARPRSTTSAPWSRSASGPSSCTTSPTPACGSSAAARRCTPIPR